MLTILIYNHTLLLTGDNSPAFINKTLQNALNAANLSPSELAKALQIEKVQTSYILWNQLNFNQIKSTLEGDGSEPVVAGGHSEGAAAAGGAGEEGGLAQGHRGRNQQAHQVHSSW